MNKFRKSAGVILKYGDEVLLCKRGPKETLPNIWSIPGGGIENGESPGQAAIREFHEETGYDPSKLQNIQNLIPYEEIFTGSNYKSYKHKYYIMYMDYNNSLEQNKFEESEVSKMEWKTYSECVSSIRAYNSEKLNLLLKIHNCITRCTIM